MADNATLEQTRPVASNGHEANGKAPLRHVLEFEKPLAKLEEQIRGHMITLYDHGAHLPRPDPKPHACALMHVLGRDWP